MKKYRPQAKWKLVLYEIIFEADTPGGKWFDVGLILFIALSILLALLDSVKSINSQYGQILSVAEWFFTIVFTVEYIFRLISIKNPWAYATSFYGIIDLISILPTFIGVIFGNMPSLMFIRVLRVLRVFRVFKLGKYTRQAKMIMSALKASIAKIVVFLMGVGTIVIIVGAFMNMIEGPENGFTSIPKGIYWAIVTMTTVGYGDVAPKTTLGQVLASIIMIIGYGIIAVPTGIVSVEIAKASRSHVSTQVCPHCAREGHEVDAKYCRYCGKKLNQ